MRLRRLTNSPVSAVLMKTRWSYLLKKVGSDAHCSLRSQRLRWFLDPERKVSKNRLIEFFLRRFSVKSVLVNLKSDNLTRGLVLENSTNNS